MTRHRRPLAVRVTESPPTVAPVDTHSSSTDVDLAEAIARSDAEIKAAIEAPAGLDEGHDARAKGAS